ncbi:iron-sulfur cluster insertion protein ErpA [Buchnera aphidicola (Melanaphis sacchari)]|uniref:Iron-sulfur cluster insertion protein ErpA n=1 Tax=Buchnera aphidicola (Melanaphis sacchari) TaxID=2173854 RepID=A0A2U8DFH0_9GAMM|nr:iron-sulfur cluster insertion protein ErpA [Buchnera aphidicola]AWH90560.1 iron-sulfur cluster insertion protein ErpA [Buchnera aphidicola (Melanaphis sacchari)]
MKKNYQKNLNFSKKATEKIKKIINNEKNKNLKLRVYIVGGGCSGFQYQFIFEEKINENDILINQLNFSIVIDPISLQYLYGGTIDYIENLEGSKFIVFNPNAKNTCGCGASFSI